VLGNSSKVLNSFFEQSCLKNDSSVSERQNPNTIDVNPSSNAENALLMGSSTDISQTASLGSKSEDGVIRTFCIKQHRHDCFRKRIAEFILNPPVVMDHKRKAFRSLARHLKMYGVTAEELMASDVPLPPNKSKPLNVHTNLKNKIQEASNQLEEDYKRRSGRREKMVKDMIWIIFTILKLAFAISPMLCIMFIFILNRERENDPGLAKKPDFSIELD
ncbi:hypothetical protein FG386_002215, partial [Cryptosporidium ryanae]|uniref:uncharacterized protein n=1 Tax=Cryptosporidium ryanae TaxID=515981 RepID=UPI00351A5DAC